MCLFICIVQVFVCGYVFILWGFFGGGGGGGFVLFWGFFLNLEYVVTISNV